MSLIYIHILIYEGHKQENNIKKLQLTSVKVVSEEYKKFKIKCIETSLNLQELVNTSLTLYNEDQSDFEHQIHLSIASGSFAE